MNFFKNFIIFGLIFLFIGDAYSQKVKPLFYQKLTPPEIIIPPDVKTITFVHRNLKFSSDSINRYYKFINKLILDTGNYEYLLTYSVYKGFKDSVSPLYNFGKIPYIVLPEEQLENKDDSIAYEYPPIPWQLIDSISEAKVSDIVLSLEKIAVFTTYDIFAHPIYEYFYGAIEIVILANIKIYDPHLRKILNDEFMVDTLFFEELGGSVKEIKEKFLSRENIMKEAGEFIGISYAEKISPQWETTKRYYFTTSKDKRMKTASYLIQTDKFQDAILLWKKIYTSTTDYDIKAKVAYNIATFREINNDIISAENWIENAIENFNLDKNKKYKKLAEDYKTQIKKRKEEIRKIKEIFTPEEDF